MTGAEFLLRYLRDQGVSHVFLVPAGHIDPLVAASVSGTEMSSCHGVRRFGHIDRGSRRDLRF